jgi:hypothetical protein
VNADHSFLSWRIHADWPVFGRVRAILFSLHPHTDNKLADEWGKKKSKTGEWRVHPRLIVARQLTVWEDADTPFLFFSFFFLPPLSQSNIIEEAAKEK